MESENMICHEIQSRFDRCELGLEHLAEDERQAMGTHFESCNTCQKWLSEWELIKLCARDLPQLEVPPVVLQKIMAQVGARKEQRFFSRDWLYPGAGLSLLCLASALSTTTDARELTSWCLCFIIIATAHYLWQGRLFATEES